MDDDYNGRLTKEEVIDGLRKMGMENPEEETERIFTLADLDGSGYLEFNEWCNATMDKTKLLKRPRLWAAFSLIDKDQSGFISYDEIKEIMGGGAIHYSRDEYFKKLIGDIDTDGDGQVSFEEFEAMMLMLVDTGGKTKI